MGVMIPRPSHIDRIRSALARSTVVILIGPRQCGKTTLARELVPVESINYFDLEDPASLARLDEPMTSLSPLRGLIVIDEIQRRPELFPILRVLSDRQDSPAQFLILGSASGDLLRQSSESLAGRTEHLSLSGFHLNELPEESASALWLRGGFPLSYLAATDSDSAIWRSNFIQSLLERDLPQWGVRVPAIVLRRFWTMLAHYHGQTWNAAEPARALDVAPSTTRRYLDLLSDAFMIRQLQPYHANIRKRQVKAPKVYIRDSGLLHLLLGIQSQVELHNHPKLGASWEGFVIEQLLTLVQPDEAYFWATHQGAEIDLVLQKNGRWSGIECKRTDAPSMTRSMTSALNDLGLERITVIYPGQRRFPLGPAVEAVPYQMLQTATSASILANLGLPHR
jgi:hypothetical protein|tara:strand:- start:2132 stop:3316 length:1185 start_codon:yes stop_codon:yes gene_type:complete